VKEGSSINPPQAVGKLTPKQANTTARLMSRRHSRRYAVKGVTNRWRTTMTKFGQPAYTAIFKWRNQILSKLRRMSGSQQQRCCKFHSRNPNIGTLGTLHYQHARGRHRRIKGMATYYVGDHITFNTYRLSAPRESHGHRFPGSWMKTRYGRPRVHTACHPRRRETYGDQQLPRSACG